MLLGIALLAAGCTASKALRMGDEATKAGDFDQAVAYYRTAVQSAPDNPNYKIALQRAMLAASRVHLDRAREFEKNDQLEAARSEYKLTSEYDPQNAFASAMVATLDQRIRNRIEASRPRPLDQLREQARAAAPLPLLNPSTDRVSLHFTNTRVGDVLNTIANASGINVTFDAQANINGPITIQIDDLSVDQALNMVLSMSQNSYKVINQRSVFIFPDTLQKHGVYDDQVVQIFYVANADVTELAQLLSQIVRFNGIAIQPVISANARTNTITARATPSVMQIIERIIQQNDKPRAEIVFDIEILEVDRERVKAVRPESHRIRHRRYLLPRSVSGGDHDTGNGNVGVHDDRGFDDSRRRAIAAAVQPQHHLARFLDDGFLPRDSRGDRPVPRKRRSHKARREAAGAWG